MCHTDGYVAEGVEIDVRDVADAADGVHVVEAVHVIVVGRIDVDDAGT